MIVYHGAIEANGVEAREDIGFIETDKGLIQDIIFDLAHPIITGELSPQKAQEIIDDLERGSRTHPATNPDVGIK